MTKKVSTETENISITTCQSETEELLAKATRDLDPQVKTWLTTASDDELIALWSARYGEGWRVSNLEYIKLKWEDNFDASFAREMSRRGLIERHHHMAEQVTLYKLKCKS
jgi:hypothetical protein